MSDSDKDQENNNDIPQPVFDTQDDDSAGRPIGEVPDPVFDDGPIIPQAGEIPDPVFEDDDEASAPKRTRRPSSTPKPTEPAEQSVEAQPNEEIAAPAAQEDTVPLPEELMAPAGGMTPAAAEGKRDLSAEELGAASAAMSGDQAAPAAAEKVQDMDGLQGLDDVNAMLGGASKDDEELVTDMLGKDEYSELSEKDPTLKKVIIAAGWDLKQFEGDAVDLDLSCFLLGKNGETRYDSDFVFYNNQQGADLAVKHSGDNRTGAGDGDDEVISIDLQALPYDIDAIMFVVSIYQGDQNEQNFGSVKNAYIRIVNAETNFELARFDLSKDFHDGTAMKFGEMLREGSNWRFHAMGETFEGGLSKVAQEYGLLIAGT